MARTNARLTGKRSQCTGCGEVFSTEANFDKHRRGKFQPDERHCVDPESIGLEIKTCATGTYWAMPGR